MDKFGRHFIVPIARRSGWKTVCEIGASTGLTTDELLKLPLTSYTIVDRCFDAELASKYSGDARVKVQRCNSLDALPKLAGTYDCILIDGDHNWFTVFNELRLIQRGLLNRGGMILFHDVEWPYGRRDMYYQPDAIPPEFRLDYERKGIIRGKSQLADSDGENLGMCNAVREGGPRNGVSTAIEDFHAENPSDYRFCRVRLKSGLGILEYRNKRPSRNLSFLLLRIKAGIYSVYVLMNRRTGSQ